MAEQIDIILQRMLDRMADVEALAGLTSNSQVAVYRNLFHTTAVEISVMEQLIDTYISNIETIINAQAIGSETWLREKVLQFQNGDFVELDTDTFTIQYPEIIEANKIITRCSVKGSGNLITLVKVAKSDPPEKLDGGEISALEDYLDIIKPAGTNVNVISLDADKLYISGIVYASGQYSSVIQDNVEAALTSYMVNLSNSDNFDGTVRVLEVIDAIQSVEGVVDFRLDELSARADLTAFIDREIVYKLSTGTNTREYITASGYIVEETESGGTFADTLTYTFV